MLSVEIGHTAVKNVWGGGGIFLRIRPEKHWCVFVYMYIYLFI
jgi:hypothetical protein